LIVVINNRNSKAKVSYYIIGSSELTLPFKSYEMFIQKNRFEILLQFKISVTIIIKI